MQKFLLLSTVIPAVSFAATPQKSREVAVQHPNIILIITDQHNVDMIHALGGANSQYVSTPHLDRLVNSGYSFTNCWCTNPLSVPSRFAMLTGESPLGYGVRNNYPPPELREKIVPMLEQRAMGAWFRKAGYQTYYGGKVHAPFANGNSMYNDIKGYGFEFIETGDRQPLADAGSKLLRERTSTDPFLLVLSFINPHDICMEANEMIQAGGKRGEEVDRNSQRYRQIMGDLQPVRDAYMAKGSECFESDAVVPLPSNFAVADKHPVARERANANPLRTDAEWRRYIWAYHRLVERVDRQIGQVLDALDASPFRDHTFVVFTSDHGEMAASHQLVGKNILLNECQKVPFVISGKGITPRTDAQTVVNNGLDLLPTLCGIAGIAAPEELAGSSLWGLVQGMQDAKPMRDYLFLECFNAFQLLQQGRYKYTICERVNDFPEMFVDLANDPLEKGNAIDDPASKAKIEELRIIMQRELATHGYTLTKTKSKK